MRGHIEVTSSNAIWLKEFHTKLAQARHNGEAVLDMVPECSGPEYAQPVGGARLF